MLKIKNFFFNLIYKNKDSRIDKKVLKSHENLFGKIKNIQHIKTHKNNVSLFFLNKDNTFRKFSCNPQGIDKINSDYRGLNWYCKQIKLDKKRVIKYFYLNKKYAVLDLNIIKGTKIKSWRPLSINYSYLKNVFSHYKKVFKPTYLHKIHGDFTFDNFLFYKKKIFVIDWEFYSKNKYLWGYDLVYLTLSTVCIPYLANGIFSKEDEKIFIKMWKKLIDMQINKKLIYNPFKYFEHVFKNDKALNLSLKISQSKFFPLAINNKFKKKILKIIYLNFKKKGN